VRRRGGGGGGRKRRVNHDHGTVIIGPPLLGTCWWSTRVAFARARRMCTSLALMLVFREPGHSCLEFSCNVNE
jgi:hypothetical protein